MKSKIMASTKKVVSSNDLTGAAKINYNGERKKGTVNGMSISKQWASIKESITIEPLVFCFATADAMSQAAEQNLELKKACRVSAKFNNTVCNTILGGIYAQENFIRENDIVQSHLAFLNSWENSANSLIAALVVLLLASYSDRYRIRKPFILCSILGKFVELGGCLVCEAFEEASLEVVGFADSITPAIFGTTDLFYTVIIAYVADISTLQMRTTRVATVELISTVCLGVGISLGGVIVRNYGGVLIFANGSILCVIAFLYGVFVLEDPKTTHKNQKLKTAILDMFNPQHIVEPFKLFFKYKGVSRNIIITILLILFIYNTITAGEGNVLFLFTESCYKWTVEEFSFYASIQNILRSVGLTLAVTLFITKWKFNDLTIIVLSFLNRILSNTIYTIITTPLGLLIGTTAGILQGLATTGIRSQLTKYVLQDDVCKMLSVYAVVSLFSNGVGAVIYNEGIYEQTRNTYPQAFFVFGIGLSMLAIVILMCMYFITTRNVENVIAENAEKSDKDNNTLDIETTHT